MIYGYCRISTGKQSIERQIRNIKAAYYKMNHKVEKSNFSIIIRDLHQCIEKQQILQADMIIHKKSGRVYDIAV